MTDDPIKVAWAAGFYEGEGYVIYYWNHGRVLRVVVSQGNPEPLVKLAGYFGGRIYFENQERRRLKMSRWHLTGVAAVTFLMEILPHLSAPKAAQAEMCCDFYKRGLRRSSGRLRAAA